MTVIGVNQNSEEVTVMELGVTGITDDINNCNDSIKGK